MLTRGAPSLNAAVVGEGSQDCGFSPFINVGRKPQDRHVFKATELGGQFQTLVCQTQGQPLRLPPHLDSRCCADVNAESGLAEPWLCVTAKVKEAGQGRQSGLAGEQEAHQWRLLCLEGRAGSEKGGMILRDHSALLGTSSQAWNQPQLDKIPNLVQTG